MHVPAGGLSPIHFLQAPSTELLTILKTTLRSQCMLPPPPLPDRGANPPRIPGAPRAVLLNQVRAVFAGRTEPVWLLH